MNISCQPFTEACGLTQSLFDDEYDPLLHGLPDVIEDEDPGAFMVASRLIKPPKNCVFRTNPDTLKLPECYFLMIKEDFGSQNYLVAPNIARMFPNQVTKVWVVPYMDSFGVIRFWLIKPELMQGPQLSSAKDVINKAQKQWVSLTWRGRSRLYGTREADIRLGNPSWPHDEELYCQLKGIVSGVIRTREEMLKAGALG